MAQRRIFPGVLDLSWWPALVLCTSLLGCGSLGWRMQQSGQPRPLWRVEGYEHWFRGLSFLPYGRLFVWDGGENTAKILRAGDGKLVDSWRRNSFYDKLALSPDGRYLAVSDGDFIELRRASTGRRIWERPVPQGLVGAWDPLRNRILIGTMEFSRNGLWLVSGSWEVWWWYDEERTALVDSIHLWRVADGTLVRAFGAHRGGGGSGGDFAG